MHLPVLRSTRPYKPQVTNSFNQWKCIECLVGVRHCAGSWGVTNEYRYVQKVWEDTMMTISARAWSTMVSRKVLQRKGSLRRVLKHRFSLGRRANIGKGEKDWCREELLPWISHPISYINKITVHLGLRRTIHVCCCPNRTINLFFILKVLHLNNKFYSHSVK